EGHVTWGARWIGAAAVALASGGCVYPLEVALEAWSWGASWEGTWDEAPAEVRGEGEVVTEARAVPGFDAVAVAGPLRVVLERSGRHAVAVTAEENLLPFLETEVRGGVLQVGPVAGVSLEPGEEILVHVECEEVVELSASASSVVEADLGWLPELWMSLSGGATLTVQGEAERQHATLSGASRLDALDLRAERLDARLSGASEALVWVKHRLDVDARGASRLRFRGNPVVDARASAGSSVTRYGTVDSGWGRLP
ncbi:MAG: hypothetical protein FIA95_07745, partial [Gemmatimonadetes bacterium]|nr:hypothetical protein [Gemmatimonadota bacterium]